MVLWYFTINDYIFQTKVIAVFYQILFLAT